ncbi:MAG: hypothetical protein ABIH23_20130 [bacterium]
MGKPQVLEKRQSAEILAQIKKEREEQEKKRREEEEEEEKDEGS